MYQQINSCRHSPSRYTPGATRYIFDTPRYNVDTRCYDVSHATQSCGSRIHRLRHPYICRHLKSVEAQLLRDKRPTTMPKVRTEEDHVPRTHCHIPARTISSRILSCIFMYRRRVSRRVSNFVSLSAHVSQLRYSHRIYFRIYTVSNAYRDVSR